MAAAGRVCTGFSKPYVALYENNGGTVTYSDGQILARGVDVDIQPEASDDDVFHADNISAENSPGVFIGGTVTLTVDGLLFTTERFIMGLPEPREISVGERQVKMLAYGDNMNIPYVGIGYIARYQSDGVVSYVPTILTKTRFTTFNSQAATQEESIDWQTQELNATILKDDTTTHDWKLCAEGQNTEADAEAVIRAFFNIPD